MIALVVDAGPMSRTPAVRGQEIGGWAGAQHVATTVSWC